MTVIPITCDNCGAKYKLPPTFKGSQAKCQKCGSVIDVAKQRESAGDGDASPAAGAKPAKARPAAAAKPAVDRSKSRAKPATGGRKAAAAAKDDGGKPARASSSRSRRGAKDDDDGGDSPRRGREKKKDNTPMILGGVGLVAILVVVAVLMMKGDDKKDSNENAEANKTAKADPNVEGGAEGGAKAATAADANANSGDTLKPADAGDPAATGDKPGDAKKPDEMPAPDAGKPEATKPADAGAPMPSDLDPTRKKERWEKQRNPARTMGDVRSAADQYGEVQWPDSIDAATKTEVMGLVENLDPLGGISSTRAKNKLVKMGYPGLFGILERLRTLDYTQPDDGLYGFELNKALENMTGGMTASYQPVQAGEEMHPAKAQWNTKNVGAWMKAFKGWPDAAAFKKAKIARAKKNK